MSHTHTHTQYFLWLHFRCFISHLFARHRKKHLFQFFSFRIKFSFIHTINLLFSSILLMSTIILWIWWNFTNKLLLRTCTSPLFCSCFKQKKWHETYSNNNFYVLNSGIPQRCLFVSQFWTWTYSIPFGTTV